VDPAPGADNRGSMIRADRLQRRDMGAEVGPIVADEHSEALAPDHRYAAGSGKPAPVPACDAGRGTRGYRQSPYPAIDHTAMDARRGSGFERGHIRLCDEPGAAPPTDASSGDRDRNRNELARVASYSYLPGRATGT
jgi:hypothetical protein